MNQPARNADRQPNRNLAEGLKALVGRLQSTADERVGKRRPLEERWIEDLQQYHGQYDEETRKKLAENEASQLFMNQTQPKTDAMAAKLGDLLFPTDDKNWGIKPTPQPRLTQAASKATMAAVDLRKRAEEARQAQQAQEAGADPQKLEAAEDLEEQAEVAEEAARVRQTVINEAKTRSDRMSETMDDQLKQCRYQACMRDVITEGCKLGSGIVKGPITGMKTRKGWKKQPVEVGEGETAEIYQLQMSEGNQPAYAWVDIWSFFPDMDARNCEESEGFFERHLKNKQELRKLARLPGFDKDAIRRLLVSGPADAAPSYLADVRSITSSSEPISKQYFTVWEYTGPITGEEMQLLAEAFNDEDTQKEVEEVDPLDELHAVVWFCGGEVLKFAIYPMDSGEPIYSVFSLLKEEASIFGKGIPAMMRDPQSALNAAWRAMMDNAGLASGPQVLVNTSYVEPADGDYKFKPRKIWFARAGMSRETRAFDTFNIEMHQTEIANIIELSKQMIDDMTSMPQITQGESGNGVGQTVGGAVLIMNSTNVVFRRVVKDFDDDVTVPNIRRLYDWNMQFSQDESIKGDYEVDARGSSVLLVRELQAQNLFLIALHLGAHPVYGPMLKQRNVLKLLFQAHMIPADEILLSEDEIAETVDAATLQAQAQQQMAQVEQEKVNFEREKFTVGAEKDIQIANLRYQQAVVTSLLAQETELMKLAQQSNMNSDTLEVKLAEISQRRATEQEKLESAEKKLAAELEATAIFGPTGGGVV